MGDSAATSGSVASSDVKRSLPASSAGEPRVSEHAGDAPLRVDFYVLDDASPSARLRLACRIAEKAYLAAQSALIWHSDPEELRTLDELLWTFMDGSFVPHELLSAGGAVSDAPSGTVHDAGALGTTRDSATASDPSGMAPPVLLSAGTLPPGNIDVIINLAPGIPPCLSRSRRVAEIVDADEARRRAGRLRFKAYREMGVQPASHPIRAE